MNEVELIRNILRGDSQSFAYFTNTYAKLCFSVIYKIVGDSIDSQDLVQDTFVTAYEKLSSFKGDSKFSTWLYRIAANKALTFVSKRKYFGEVDDIRQEDESYDKELDQTNSRLLKQALIQLNERERLIIELFYYQEQSVKEISFICDTTESNIKVLLHRARKKMNEYISKSAKFAANE